MNNETQDSNVGNPDTGFLKRLRQWTAARRISLNRAILVIVLIALTHPRSRVFFAAGLLLAFAGALLRLWARLTPPERPGGLIRRGPYQLVRHPMYLGTGLQAFGMWVSCFGFRHFMSFILLGLVLGGYMLFVYKEAILLEEEDLMNRWSGEWEIYAARTPAFWPVKEALKSLRWSALGPLDWRRLEATKEWRNFMACLGIFAFLWFKLVYGL